MNRYYKGMIFTNHALNRMRERGVSSQEVWAAWYKPEQSHYAKTKGAWTYYKTIGDKKIKVVAKKNQKNQWVILSAWNKQAVKKFSEAKTAEPLLKRFLKRLFSTKLT